MSMIIFVNGCKYKDEVLFSVLRIHVGSYERGSTGYCKGKRAYPPG